MWITKPLKVADQVNAPVPQTNQETVELLWDMPADLSVHFFKHKQTIRVVVCYCHNQLNHFFIVHWPAVLVKTKDTVYPGLFYACYP